MSMFPNGLQPHQCDSLEITFKKLLEAGLDGGFAPASNWILRTGLWDDSGVWDDTAVWID